MSVRRWFKRKLNFQNSIYKKINFSTMIVVFFLLFSLDDSFFMQWYNCSNVWLLQRQKKNWSFLSEKKEFLIKRSHPKFGNISQMLDPPPPPPFSEPLFPTKKMLFVFHFRSSGAFLVFTKMFTFWSLSWNFLFSLIFFQNVPVFKSRSGD